MIRLPAAPALLSVVLLVLWALSGCSQITGDDGSRADEAAEPVSDTDESDPDQSDTAESETDTSGESLDRPIEQPLIDFDPVFSPGACTESLPSSYQVECGTVRVPMNWETGEGSVDLAVAVFAAQPEASDDGTSDNAPVFYLEGGPGGHALEVLQFTATDLVDPLLPDRTVVVFDQRGAGLSEPNLGCRELTEFSRKLEDTIEISDDDVDRDFHDALGRCRQRLVSEGIDLASFNTRFNARDVDAIREALGYERISLLGVSYGTKLGLEVLRRHPESVAAAVLDSVYPPQVDSVQENAQTFIDSYRKVVVACEAEPGCRADGDLDRRLAALAVRLQDDPIEVTVEDWITGETDSVYVNGDTLVGIVTQSLYSPQSFSDVPELVDDLEAGGVEVVEQYLSQQRTTERFFTNGMFYAFTCRDEVSFADPDLVEDPPDPFGLRASWDLASNVGTNAFETCEAFDSGRSPDIANEPVRSDVPTLLLAGSYDPVTPVAWARSAAETLPNSQVVVAAHGSHGIATDDCGMSIVIDFLDAPDSVLNTECMDEQLWGFVDAPAVALELTDAVYTSQGITVSTVRPDSWSVGSLEGDQYRQLSFLDSAQLHQLAGDQALGQALAQFIESSQNVELGPPEVFGPSAELGPIRGAASLDHEWTRRSGRNSGTRVEWFERQAGAATVYVILVAPAAEYDSLIAEVFEPALTAITVEPGD